MLRKIHKGSTDQIITIYIRDVTSNSNAGLTGLTAASGIACKYKRDDQPNVTTVTLQSAAVGVYTPGGFVAVPGMPGVYEFGVPDSALSSGSSTTLLFYDIPGGAVVPVLIELDAVDYQDAATFGLTAVPASLVATGMDAISVADPGAPANMSTLPRLIVALWRAVYKPTRLTPNAYIYYKDDAFTVNATQTFVDNTVDQIKGGAQ